MTATLRVDLIGGMRRPEALTDSRARRDVGELSEGDFRRIVDDAIRALIKEEEAHGLPVVTDGEFRRHNFQESFGGAVTGFDASPYVQRPDGERPTAWWPGRIETGVSAPGPAILNRLPVKERLTFVRNPILDEYRFSISVATVPVKLTLIGPDRISQRFEWESSQAIYPDMDAFLEHVVGIERRMIAEVVDAGCRYVQIDAPGFTAYVDPPSLERMRSRGEDPDVNLERSIRAENAIIADFPGVTFGLHVCRGNGPGWHREGYYDAIAERLFTGLNHDRLLLEYDTERAGNFEPLRFVPKGKIAVLGLISTKLAHVETANELQKRIEDASRYLPLEQLALSPQCGFGGLVTEGELWGKIDAMIETSRRVWGGPMSQL
jgi:5-methyltetrahydropteroyltriglutamate--homocysteine methyltransferase